MPGTVAATLDQSFPATPREVAHIRHAVVEAAADAGVAAGRRDDIGLAVSEAATNVVVHAYRDSARPGAIRIVAEAARDRFDVVISDTGRGLGPRPDSPGLGLGLPLITMLADAVEFRSADPDGGTELLLHFATASA